MKIIYVAGPYNAETHSEIEDNIRKAEKAAVELWCRGWAVICPHLNTAHFERYQLCSAEGKPPIVHYLDFYRGYFEILKKCDAIFMLKDWTKSQGSKEENKIAKDKNLEIYYEPQGYPIP